MASWKVGVNGVGFSYATGPLPTPAYRLNFVSHGRHAIGLDDLTLTPVPAPGAALRRLIDAAVVHRLRRRKAR